MALGQLGKVTHVRVTGDALWSKFASLGRQVGDIELAAVAIAAGTIALVLLTKRFWPRIPGALVAVVGTLHGSLPRPELPPFSDLGALLVPALGILLVSYTDNVLTARAFATRGGYEIDANQEFLALGACNTGSALSQGFPVSSSTSRTALGDAAGSRRQLTR